MVERRGSRSFFFQAEDGIRARNVTGVQTCALPIYDLPVLHRLDELAPLRLDSLRHLGDDLQLRVDRGLEGVQVEEALGQQAQVDARLRSEERRVGKERGSGWGA